MKPRTTHDEYDALTTFLVRGAEQHDIIGVVRAEDADEMCSLIDEFTDPYSCEVAKVNWAQGFAAFGGDISEALLCADLKWFPATEMGSARYGRVARAHNELRFAEREAAALAQTINGFRRKINERHGRNSR